MYAPPISTHRFRERIFVGVVLEQDELALNRTGIPESAGI